MKTEKKLQFCFRLTNKKGISAVEFALVLPIFLAIFFGIIEYGWVMTQQIVLSHAVSEGARAAIKTPDGMSDEELTIVARDAVKDAFSLVGTLADGHIAVNVLDASEEEPPIPRRISVVVTSWAYTPIVGYLPNAAVPGTLRANAIFAFP